MSTHDDEWSNGCRTGQRPADQPVDLDVSLELVAQFLRAASNIGFDALSYPNEAHLLTENYGPIGPDNQFEVVSWYE